eukprot:3192915-Pyramimonas_sp.AAC.1
MAVARAAIPVAVETLDRMLRVGPGQPPCIGACLRALGARLVQRCGGVEQGREPSAPPGPATRCDPSLRLRGGGEKTPDGPVRRV